MTTANHIQKPHPSTVSPAKKMTDITGALFLLIVFGPVMFLIAIATRVTSGRPVFFRHERIGLREHPFELIKFRTMRTPHEWESTYQSDAERITGVGRVLRKLSLDELPQVWNVLRGELSLVGPRPLLSEYLPVYTERQRRRHEVKPGITGWAQINGRNTLKLSERRELDVWYVENWSVFLDAKILARTIAQTLFAKGVKPVARMADVDDQGFEAALQKDDSSSVEENVKEIGTPDNLP